MFVSTCFGKQALVSSLNVVSLNDVFCFWAMQTNEKITRKSLCFVFFAFSLSSALGFRSNHVLFFATALNKEVRKAMLRLVVKELKDTKKQMTELEPQLLMCQTTTTFTHKDCTKCILDSCSTRYAFLLVSQSN